MREFPAERLVQKVVLGRGREVLDPADYVADAHKMIVDNVGEVIRRHTVRLYKDVVFEFLVLDRDIAENHIVIGRRTGFGNILTDNVRLARGYAAFDLLAGKRQTVFVVLCRAVLVHFRKAFFGAETIVRVALLDELPRVFKVNILSFGLNIRTVLAAHVRTFVPDKSRLAHGGIDNFHRAVHVAFEVGVLDAKNKLAAVLFRVKVRVKRGSEPADVQITRGTWRKSGSDFHLSLLSLTKAVKSGIIATETIDRVCFTRIL